MNLENIRTARFSRARVRHLDDRGRFFSLRPTPTMTTLHLPTLPDAAEALIQELSWDTVRDSILLPMLSAVHERFGDSYDLDADEHGFIRRSDDEDVPAEVSSYARDEFLRQAQQFYDAMREEGELTLYSYYLSDQAYTTEIVASLEEVPEGKEAESVEDLFHPSDLS